MKLPVPRRALHVAAFMSLTVLIFFALDYTARAGGGDALALHFDHQPSQAPYLCVAKPKTVKRVV